MLRRKLRAWGVKSHQYPFKSRYLNVRKDMVLRPDGQLSPYITIERLDFAVIIPRFSNGDVVMVRQYRYPLGKYTWEFPMGIVQGVSLRDAAKIELIQETGYRAKRWRKLGTYAVAAGMTDQKAHIYLAESLTPGPPEPEVGEFITSRRFPESKIKEWITSHRLQDGPSLVAWLYFKKS